MANVETTNFRKNLQCFLLAFHRHLRNGTARFANKSDVYEASALATGSTISFGDLPRGAVIRNVQAWTDAFGVGTSIERKDWFNKPFFQ